MPVREERKQMEQCIDSIEPVLPRHAAQCGNHVEILPCRQIQVEIGLLWNVPDPFLICGQVVSYGTSVKQDFSGCGFNQTGNHLHRCTFTRAVGADVPEDFPSPQTEIDAIDYGYSAVNFPKIPCCEHSVSMRPPREAAYLPRVPTSIAVARATTGT